MDGEQDLDALEKRRDVENRQRHIGGIVQLLDRKLAQYADVDCVSRGDDDDGDGKGNKQGFCEFFAAFHALEKGEHKKNIAEGRYEQRVSAGQHRLRPVFHNGQKLRGSQPHKIDGETQQNRNDDQRPDQIDEPSERVHGDLAEEYADNDKHNGKYQVHAVIARSRGDELGHVFHNERGIGQQAQKQSNPENPSDDGAERAFHDLEQVHAGAQPDNPHDQDVKERGGHAGNEKGQPAVYARDYVIAQDKRVGRYDAKMRDHHLEVGHFTIHG